MIINKLSLINFKNHREKSFEFSPQINCFVGDNGVGKTNVLDALHYLSVGKSFLGNSDLNNILSQKSEEGSQKMLDFFVIDAEIKNDEKEDIIRILQPKESKKVIKKNDKTYDRLADLIPGKAAENFWMR
jgi:DNA replication and repair protein RecF